MSRSTAMALLGVFVCAAGCGSRTGLEVGELEGTPPPADAGDTPDVAVGPDAPDEPEAPPDAPCVPNPEVCDGIDNNCNGEVDEGIRSQACTTGGARYCVLGLWTACPPVCIVCVPGSTRYCDTPTYCSWGIQTCNADGATWGACAETSPPAGCSAGFGYDESCCLRTGHCCQDLLDQNGNGDYHDSIGACPSCR